MEELYLAGKLWFQFYLNIEYSWDILSDSTKVESIPVHKQIREINASHDFNIRGYDITKAKPYRIKEPRRLDKGTDASSLHDYD